MLSPKEFCSVREVGPRKFNEKSLHRLSEADETRSFGNVLEPR